MSEVQLISKDEHRLDLKDDDTMGTLIFENDSEGSLIVYFSVSSSLPGRDLSFNFDDIGKQRLVGKLLDIVKFLNK